MRVAIIHKSMMLISVVIHIAFMLQVLTSEKFWAVAPPSETKRHKSFSSPLLLFILLFLVSEVHTEIDK